MQFKFKISNSNSNSKCNSNRSLSLCSFNYNKELWYCKCVENTGTHPKAEFSNVRFNSSHALWTYFATQACVLVFTYSAVLFCGCTTLFANVHIMHTVGILCIGHSCCTDCWLWHCMDSDSPAIVFIL